ncbi:hypothetical protein MMC08_007577 [Hypocenomyce scalaris]|nr:hypothetical protein [Hypocenomyce scalaris]
MERFAGVMNKFGDVVGNINRTLANPNGNAIPLETEPVTGTEQTRLATSASQGHTGFQRQDPTQHTTVHALDPPHLATDQSQRINTFLTPSSSYIDTNIPPATQSMYSTPPPAPFPSQPAHSLWPQMTSSNNLAIHDRTATGANQLHWYEDPLDALANGQIVHWTDLDAFIGGQVE